jgi:membrane protein DedA with SNARE-associated domain
MIAFYRIFRSKAAPSPRDRDGQKKIVSTSYIEYLIRTYGYWALFAGTFPEGETILVIGGLFARMGLLDLPAVMLVASLGSFTGDQFYFI